MWCDDFQLPTDIQKQTYAGGELRPRSDAFGERAQWRHWGSKNPLVPEMDVCLVRDIPGKTRVLSLKTILNDALTLQRFVCIEVDEVYLGYCRRHSPVEMIPDKVAHCTSAHAPRRKTERAARLQGRHECG